MWAGHSQGVHVPHIAVTKGPSQAANSTFPPGSPGSGGLRSALSAAASSLQAAGAACLPRLPDGPLWAPLWASPVGLLCGPPPYLRAGSMAPCFSVTPPPPCASFPKGPGDVQDAPGQSRTTSPFLECQCSLVGKVPMPRTSPDVHRCLGSGPLWGHGLALHRGGRLTSRGLSLHIQKSLGTLRTPPCLGHTGGCCHPLGRANGPLPERLREARPGPGSRETGGRLSRSPGTLQTARSPAALGGHGPPPASRPPPRASRRQGWEREACWELSSWRCCARLGSPAGRARSAPPLQVLGLRAGLLLLHLPLARPLLPPAECSRHPELSSSLHDRCPAWAPSTPSTHRPHLLVRASRAARLSLWPLESPGPGRQGQAAHVAENQSCPRRPSLSPRARPCPGPWESCWGPCGLIMPSCPACPQWGSRKLLVP